jgi:hypothetical protein
MRRQAGGTAVTSGTGGRIPRARRALFAASALLALSVVGVVAQAGPPPEPLSRWSPIDAEIANLVVRGVLPVEALAFLPIDRAELARWLGAETRGGAAAGGLSAEVVRRVLGASDSRGLRLHRSARETLISTPYLRLMPLIEDGDATWTEDSRVGLRTIYDYDSTLALVSDIFAAEVPDGRSFADPLIAGTDFILHTEEATLSARLGPLRLRAGRDRHRWGPGMSGTLLLSDDGAPFNFAEYQLRLGEHLRFLALSGFTDRRAAPPVDSAGAVLPGVNPDRARSLAAHRLQWEVTPKLTIAVAEAARYQGGAHPLYLAGIVPYTLVERLDQQGAPADSTRRFSRNNVLWSADVAWRFRPAALAHGEILADDIAMETSGMPTRGGYQFGVRWAPQWRGWDWTLGAEYTRVSNYTYSVYYQDACQCDWEHLGQPLGYGLGPDVANLLLHAWTAPSSSWSVDAWVELTRKGEGAIGKPVRPSAQGCGCGAWTLSEAITRTTAIGARVQHRFWPRPRVLCPIWLGGSAEGLWTEPGESARARVRLTVGVGG